MRVGAEIPLAVTFVGGEELRGHADGLVRLFDERTRGRGPPGAAAGVPMLGRRPYVPGELSGSAHARPGRRRLPPGGTRLRRRLRRSRHGAFRARTSRTVPSGPAPRAATQERAGAGG
jgi:hypothetical protein